MAACAGVAAGWCAASCAGFSPLLWAVLLTAVLALPPEERRLGSPGWWLAGGVVLALAWLVAADHELALGHTLLFAAAALLLGMARIGAPSGRLLGLVAAGLALTSLVAIGQACGGLERAATLVGALPPGWRAAAAARLATARVFGTAALPGHFAILMVMAAPLLGERLLRAAGWRRAGWGSLLALAGAAVALSRSLAAVGVAGALLLALLARRRSRRAGVAAAAALVVLAAAVLAGRGDLARLEPLRLRWVNWRTAAWVFLHHPWLGVGLGGVGQAGLAAPTGAANITPYAHCTPARAPRRVRRRGHPAPGGRRLGARAPAPARVAGAPGAGARRRGGPPPQPGGLLRLQAGGAAPLGGAGGFARLSGVARAATARPRARADRPPGRRRPPGRAVVAERGRGVGRRRAAAARGGRDGARRRPLGAVDRHPGGDGGRIRSRTGSRTRRARARRRRARGAVVGATALGRLGGSPRAPPARPGRPGEALVWVREARRRAPWRGDLAQLEAACARPR